MFINSILVIILIVSITALILYVRKKMDLLKTKTSDVSSLIVNCNNDKPIGDIFSNLNNLLEVNQESDHIEYGGHI